QALDFVDRRVHLALRIRVDRLDLVFAGDAALLVDEVDGDLRADRAGNRAGRRERARQVVDDADADRRLLGAGEPAAEARDRQRRGRKLEKRTAGRVADFLPGWPAQR